MPAIAPRTDLLCGSLTGNPALDAGSGLIRAAPNTQFRAAPMPARQPAGAAALPSSKVDVVPFPTLASVRQLYHFDPSLSINKYEVSNQAIERNVLPAYPMRQSGCRKPPPGSPAARSSPARAPIPLVIVAIRPRAIYTNRRLSGGRQRQGGAPNGPARILNSGPGLFHRPKTAPAANFWARYVKGAERIELRDGETISEILSGLPHSWVIEPRLSITASVSTKR